MEKHNQIDPKMPQNGPQKRRHAFSFFSLLTVRVIPGTSFSNVMRKEPKNTPKIRSPSGEGQAGKPPAHCQRGPSKVSAKIIQLYKK